MYNNLSEDLEIVKSEYDQLKKTLDEKAQKTSEIIIKPELASKNDSIRINPISAKPLIKKFLGSFFKMPLIKSAINSYMIKEKFAKQDIRKILDNMLNYNNIATKNIEISSISDMSIGEFLLNWISHQMKVVTEKLQNYIKSYGFTQLISHDKQIYDDYSINPKDFIMRFTKSIQNINDLYCIF